MTSAATRSGSEARIADDSHAHCECIDRLGGFGRCAAESSLLDLDRLVGRPAGGDRLGLLDVEIARLILEALAHGRERVRDCPGSDGVGPAPTPSPLAQASAAAPQQRGACPVDFRCAVFALRWVTVPWRPASSPSATRTLALSRAVTARSAGVHRSPSTRRPSRRPRYR